MSLQKYLFRRALLLIPVLLGVLFLAFFISYVIPADPVRSWAGPQARPEQLELF